MVRTKEETERSAKKIGVIPKYKKLIVITGLSANLFSSVYYAVNGRSVLPIHPFFVWWINITAFLGFLFLLLAINQFAKGFKRARETRWEEAWGALVIGSLLSPFTWLIFLCLIVTCAILELIAPSNRIRLQQR